MKPELSDGLQVLIDRVQRVLARTLPAQDQPPVELHRAIRYVVLGGGKRLRPLLVYASGHILGYDALNLDMPACAVELIHTYSLVHDDLPVMDNDDLRHGRPTCHVIFGQAMAILVGDALQALAFSMLAQANIDPERKITMLGLLGTACGTQGMVGGQALDLSATGQTLSLTELEHMHACKTGSLIRACVRLGALTAGADEDTLAQLDRYAAAVGLAWQVRDDLLDVEGTSGTIGKTIGKDVAAGKSTFPGTIGLHASRQRLNTCVDEALTALYPFGKQGALLRELACYVAQRTH